VNEHDAVPPQAVEHESIDQIETLAHRVRDMVRESTRPVILTHANPDADAVASVLGMRAFCEHLGVAPVLSAAGDAALPPNLAFLKGSEVVRELDDDIVSGSDLIIFVDAADASRLGPLYYRLSDELERKRPTINIDHHVTNHRFASLNIVIPTAGATSEIIAAMYDHIGLEFEPQVATTLLAGIYGDTLGLRTPSTTPETLHTAAELMRVGADLDTIIDNLFRLKPYSTVCLWGEVLQRTQWRGALIWSQIDPSMLERSGAERSEGEGIVNFLAGTIGARASALLYEETWGWRVSMRSLADDVDVSELLKRFGGGGHRRAAGARLAAGEAAREQFLDDISALLGERDRSVVVASPGDDPI
jgi:bifunctional oligoribonuclease and PAP phosphatase NrnA